MAQDRPAVQPGQVHPALRKARQRVGQAAGPVRGDKRDRSLQLGVGFAAAAISLARARGRALLHDHEPRPVLGVILDRLRQHVQRVASRGRLARDGRGARLPLLRHGPSSAGGVVKRDGADLPRVQVAVALRERLGM